MKLKYILKGFIILPILLLLFINTETIVSALEPPTNEEIEQYKLDGSLAKRIEYAKSLGNHLASPSFVARSKYKLQKILLEKQGISAPEIELLSPPPAWKGMPTTGTVNVLALLIAFSDYPFNTPAANITSMLFGDGVGGTTYDSLRNYYRRSSYNQLEIQGNVLGWYTTSYPRSNVSKDKSGRQNLIKEALNFYDAQGHDFSQYDNDGDGEIDYFIVIWTGPLDSWADFWWGYWTEFNDPFYWLDGKVLGGYSWQREFSMTPTTVIHETGHALGLPDLYDYDVNVGPDGGVGTLDMMDGNIGDHNCFSKFVLDWLTPNTINYLGSQTVTLNASGSSQDAVLIMPNVTSGNQFAEFFMVQNRFKINNDTNYPNDGLLVWHIDSSLDFFKINYLYNNSDTDHKLVRLMEADGLEEIETGDSNADAEDYYTAGDTFEPATFPNSNRYDGSSTGISVSNISASGPTMTADISIWGSIYVDKSNWCPSPNGNMFCIWGFGGPYTKIMDGVNAANPSDKWLFIKSGSYNEAITINKNMTINAWNGAVTIGQ